MMTRTQISMDREVLRKARRRAAELGISFAEYVRRLVARDMGEAPAPVDVAAVFDMGRSDGSDVARDKDAMIATALERKLAKE